MRVRWVGVALVAAATAFGCGDGGSSVGPSSVGNGGGDNGGTSGGGGGMSGGGGTSGGGGGVSGGGGSGGGGGGMGGGGGGGGGGGMGGGGGGGGGGTASCTFTGPTLLASAHAVHEVHADGSDVYYLDIASAWAGLYRVPSTGGTPTLLANVVPLQNDGIGWAFALDDGAAYLIQSTVDMSGVQSGGVQIIDKRTLQRRQVDVTRHGCLESTFVSVAAYGGTAWLAQHNGPHPSCSDTPFNTIEMLPPGATQTQTIATVADGGNPLVADGTHIFWSDIDGMFRAAHDGSGSEKLASNVVGDLATDGNALFGSNKSEIFAVTAPGQSAIVFSGPTVEDFTVDDAWLYVGTQNGVLRAPKTGGMGTAITPGPASLPAVDAVAVYWTDGSNVMAACKP